MRLTLLVFIGTFISHSAYAMIDVPMEDYRRAGYEQMVNEGILTLSADGSFQPARQMTRIEGLAAAMKAGGRSFFTAPEEGFPFSDVTEQWMRNVTWTGVQQGILSRQNAEFRPYQIITKAEYVRWLTISADLRLSAYRSQLADLSTDIERTSAYAPAFAYAKTYHIVHLHPDGSFHAFDALTRGAAAEFTVRHLEVMRSNKEEKLILRLRGQMQLFLSAIRGDDPQRAQRHGMQMKRYADQILASQSNGDALAADALSRSVEHFTRGMRAYSLGQKAKGFSEILLAAKQAQRAQAQDSRLKGFAAELEGLITETIRGLTEETIS